MRIRRLQAVLAAPAVRPILLPSTTLPINKRIAVAGMRIIAGRRRQRATPAHEQMLIMDGIRRVSHIERTAKIVIQQPQDAADHIVDVNPARYCRPLPTGPLSPEAKRREPFSQNPALRRRDNAGTQQADAGSVACARQAITCSQRAQVYA